jgi:hypothetical protein
MLPVGIHVIVVVVVVVVVVVAVVAAAAAVVVVGVTILQFSPFWSINLLIQYLQPQCP